MSKSSGPGEQGASAVEYALLIAGIVGVLVVVILVVGGAVDEMFTESCDAVDAQVAETLTCE